MTKCIRCGNDFERKSERFQCDNCWQRELDRAGRKHRQPEYHHAHQPMVRKESFNGFSCWICSENSGLYNLCQGKCRAEAERLGIPIIHTSFMPSTGNAKDGDWVPVEKPKQRSAPSTSGLSRWPKDKGFDPIGDYDGWDTDPDGNRDYESEL